MRKTRQPLYLGGHRGLGVTDHNIYKNIREVQKKPAENTLASVQAAFLSGADYVEIDAQMSKDKIIFCLHNVNPEDHFFANSKPQQYLNLLDFKEIKKFKIGRNCKDKVAKLSEILKITKKLAPNTLGWKINIEVKGVQGTNQKYENNEFLKRLVLEVKKQKFPLEQTLWSSFCLENLIKISQLSPKSNFGFLFSEQTRAKPIYIDKKNNFKFQYLPFNKRNINKVLKTWRQEAEQKSKLVYLHPELTTVKIEQLGFLKDKNIGLNCWISLEKNSKRFKVKTKRIIKKIKKSKIFFSLITDSIKLYRDI